MTPTTIKSSPKRHPLHAPRRLPPLLITEVVGLEEVLGRRLPVDLVAAFAGHRGAVLRLHAGEA